MAELIPLIDFCEEITVGHVGPLAESYIETGVPVLRSQNIQPGRIDFSGIRYISEEKHAELKKSQIRPNDVAVVRTGVPGTAAVVPEWVGVANCSDILIIRPNLSLVDPHWLAYYLNSSARQFVNAHTVGAVQQHFNVKSVKALPAPNLTLPKQIELVSVLRALDDKIEANNKLAQTAEELASSVYLDASMNSPEIVPLSTLAEFVNGKAFTKNATGSGRVVIRIAEMNSGIGPSTVFNELQVDDKYVSHPGDILFSWSGTLKVMRWILPEGIVNQHIFKVIPRDNRRPWIAFHAIQQKIAYFRNLAADKATTMGHIQRRDLDELVMVPDFETRPEIDGVLTELWNQSFTLKQEVLNVEALRDYLLPRLMSGKITVRDAEKMIG